MSALPSRSGSQSTLPVGDYEAFTTFLRRQAGIDLDQYRRRQMERRIRAFAGRLGLMSLMEYAALLREDVGERAALLDRITMAASQLFRVPDQWERIASDVVPELVATGHGRIRAWSAGGSCCAEAYSLAATVRSAVPEARLEVRASDVDRRILDGDGRGAFSSDDVRAAPPELLAKHFVPTSDGGWQAGPELLASVHFHHEDLLAVEPAPGTYDLVLCRNAVAPFTRVAREDVHTRIARSLRPGGFLVVGSTECLARPLEELGLEMAWPCAYRKAP
jgi:chemotaxis protein methyltransferase CheR